MEPADYSVDQEVVDKFHQMWVDSHCPWNVTWRGRQLVKNPLDLWMYQELIFRLAPSTIIETGTFLGGSALFMADLLELQGVGRVISVDLDPREQPEHYRVHYIKGDSVSPSVIAKVQQLIDGTQVMVVLDSDHSAEHVYKEMCLYSTFVPVGSYMIVEDSNVGGNPIHTARGVEQIGDPMTAIKRFLAERDDFVVDEECERYLISQNPSGYLRRVK